MRGKTADEDGYVNMFRTIEERGVWEIWNDTPYQYLYLGDGYFTGKCPKIFTKAELLIEQK